MWQAQWSDIAGSVAKGPMVIEKESTGLGERRRPFSKWYPVWEGMKRRRYEPKSPHVLHATKDKHQLACTTESNKMQRQQKWCEGQKETNLDGVGACTKGQGTTYLYLVNTWEVGHGPRHSEGVVWRWGENGVYSKFPIQASLGEISCWDGISSKRSKYRLGPLDACHKGRWRDSLILIHMGEIRTERGKKQDK